LKERVMAYGKTSGMAVRKAAAKKNSTSKKPAKKKAAFKPCSTCPSPAKCKKMGKCMRKKGY